MTELRARRHLVSPNRIAMLTIQGWLVRVEGVFDTDCISRPSILFEVLTMMLGCYEADSTGVSKLRCVVVHRLTYGSVHTTHFDSVQLNMARVVHSSSEIPTTYNYNNLLTTSL